VEGDQHELLRSLNRLDLSDADIDWVVLSHLHFDHAGGLLGPHRPGMEPDLLFPRARFLVSRGAWERSRQPHRRDHASFIPELPDLLERSGRLVVCDDAAAAESHLGDRYRFRMTEGHTAGMLHALVVGERASLFFCADLVPGRAWVHLPVTMGYDRHAERVVDEKTTLFLESNLAKTVFFFTHDPEVAASRIEAHEASFRAHDPIRIWSGWDIDRTERPT
jgi:glyoxylase-like metal-dependent hydrolase (beta-lactamase superfamily II)